MASCDHACDDRGDEQTTDGKHSDCEVPTGVPMMANYKKSRNNTLAEKRKMSNKEDRVSIHKKMAAVRPTVSEPLN